jgi:hypothetical protein
MLAERYPLAATLALRAMITFTLETKRSSRYPHAVRHFACCAVLARRVDDFGPVEPGDAFVARLKRTAPRALSLWSKVEV